MHVCMYACMHVCMYACMHMCTHILNRLQLYLYISKTEFIVKQIQVFSLSLFFVHVEGPEDAVRIDKAGIFCLGRMGNFL